MNCKKCHNELISYLKGSLPNERRSQIETHLSVCESCQSFAAYLTETLQVIQIEKDIEPDPFLATRIEGILQRAEPSYPAKSPVRVLVAALTFTVMIALGILGGIGLGSIILPEKNHEYSQVSPIEEMVNDMSYESVESFLLGI